MQLQPWLDFANPIILCVVKPTLCYHVICYRNDEWVDVQQSKVAWHLTLMCGRRASSLPDANYDITSSSLHYTLLQISDFVCSYGESALLDDFAIRIRVDENIFLCYSCATWNCFGEVNGGQYVHGLLERKSDARHCWTKWEVVGFLELILCVAKLIFLVFQCFITHKCWIRWVLKV